MKITFFVTISVSVGFILANGNFSTGILFPVFGVFLLSWGSAAINQIQEAIPDSQMNRTKNRPLPTGILNIKTAKKISIISVIAGSAVLFFAGILPLFLGILTLIIYNFIYTPMKMKTALAVFPGALVGALPPVIGWISGGGRLFEPQALALGLFFFIWQIPHFWLLLLIFEKDYKNAGFPVLTDMFSRRQLTRLTFVWIIALVVSCLLIPLFGTPGSPLIISLLTLAGVVLILRTKKLLNIYYNDKIYRLAFMQVNIYVLSVILLLTAGRLL